MRDVGLLFKAELIRKLLSNQKTVTRRPVDLRRLKVVPRFDVYSDVPPWGPNGAEPLCAKAGKAYPAELNPQGAVSAWVDGQRLGLKPGEFDFVCPFAEGATSGGANRWTINAWESRIWARETHAIADTIMEDGRPNVVYAAHGFNSSSRTAGVDRYGSPREVSFWRPSIHMPKWAARIWRHILTVSLERLLDITEEDAAREGVAPVWLDENQRDVRAHANPTYRQGFLREWTGIYGAESVDRNDWVWRIAFKAGGAQ
jgi:hypothetical protein